MRPYNRPTWDSLFRNNKTGVTGVDWFQPSSKWRARIKADGRYQHLGLFDTIEEATACRKAAEKLHGFDENHGRPAVKRLFRARKQAGQVHKVVVYLTEEEWRASKRWSLTCDPVDGLLTALGYADDCNLSAP